MINTINKAYVIKIGNIGYEIKKEDNNHIVGLAEVQIETTTSKSDISTTRTFDIETHNNVIKAHLRTDMEDLLKRKIVEF